MKRPNEVTLDVIDGKEVLVCDCGATAPNTATAAARFVRRHPKTCNERQQLAHALSSGTRSVNADPPEEE